MHDELNIHQLSVINVTAIAWTVNKKIETLSAFLYVSQ